MSSTSGTLLTTTLIKTPFVYKREDWFPEETSNNKFDKDVTFVRKEVRMDPEDGNLYTKEKFEDYYGDLEEWDLDSSMLLIAVVSVTLIQRKYFNRNFYRITYNYLSLNAYNNT